MTQENRCLVCGSPETGLKFMCSDHLTRSGSFEIHTCRSCGFTFTSNPPPESEIGRFYDDSEYVSHSDIKKGLTNSLYHITRSLMLRRKRALVRKITGKDTGRLLDIGCGTGYFAGFMKESGWDVTGLEINEKARNFARENFSLEVINESHIRDLPEKSFDCITMWHVFEHFHHPADYLAEVSRLLIPGGKCIIAMPNCISIDALHYGRFWAAWDVPRHLWHFNPDTFRIFSGNNGFAITRIWSLPADVFYISILSEKHMGTNLPFITGILKGVWFAAGTLFRKKMSSSLVYGLIPNLL